MPQEPHRTTRIAPDVPVIVRRATEIQGRSVSDFWWPPRKKPLVPSRRPRSFVYLSRISGASRKRFLTRPSQRLPYEKHFSGIVSCLAPNDLVRFPPGAPRRY